jgi:hypothetical protein
MDSKFSMERMEFREKVTFFLKREKQRFFPDFSSRHVLSSVRENRSFLAISRGLYGNLFLLVGALLFDE